MLQAVEGFVELANMIRQGRINKACGLLAVHGFRQGAMEEGVLDIELMNGPVPGVSQSEDSTNGGGLDDGTECLVVINTWALREAAKNPAHLVSVKGAIGMELVPKNPLPGNNVCLTGR
jgi:hypothetical protein